MNCLSLWQFLAKNQTLLIEVDIFAIVNHCAVPTITMLSSQAFSCDALFLAVKVIDVTICTVYIIRNEDMVSNLNVIFMFAYIIIRKGRKYR